MHTDVTAPFSLLFRNCSLPVLVRMHWRLIVYFPAINLTDLLPSSKTLAFLRCWQLALLGLCFLALLSRMVV